MPGRIRNRRGSPRTTPSAPRSQSPSRRAARCAPCATFARIRATMRATSSTAPALPATLRAVPRQQQCRRRSVERQIAVIVVVAVRSGLPACRRAGCRCCRDRSRSRAAPAHGPRRTDRPATHRPSRRRNRSCDTCAMPLRRVLKTIERALAGQRLAVRSQHRFQFARQHRERRVLAQLIVIDKVLVSPARGQKSAAPPASPPDARQSADRAGR